MAKQIKKDPPQDDPELIEEIEEIEEPVKPKKSTPMISQNVDLTPLINKIGEMSDKLEIVLKPKEPIKTEPAKIPEIIPQDPPKPEPRKYRLFDEFDPSVEM